LGKKHGGLNFVSTLFLRCRSSFKLGTEKNRAAWLLFHSLGLSALGAALYLQNSVFSGILLQGYFRGIEQNVAVLAFEVFLDAFAVVYFGYLFWRFVLSAI